MKLIFESFIHAATWFPEYMVEPLYTNNLIALNSGKDSIFTYKEDGENTEIVDGGYIVYGGLIGANPNFWFVELKVLSNQSGWKEIECVYRKKVVFNKFIETAGPDGLQKNIAYYGFTKTKKL